MPAVGVDQGSIAFMQPTLCLALLSVSFSFSLDCFCLRMRFAVCCYIALISLCGSSCTALLQPCSAHAKGASSGLGNIPAVGVDQGTPHNYPNGTLLGPAHLMTCKPCSHSPFFLLINPVLLYIALHCCILRFPFEIMQCTRQGRQQRSGLHACRGRGPGAHSIQDLAAQAWRGRARGGKHTGPNRCVAAACSLVG